MKEDNNRSNSVSVASTEGPRLRWRILALYAVINITNSMTWVTFSPISDETSDYFDHLGGSTAVNMLAVLKKYAH